MHEFLTDELRARIESEGGAFSIDELCKRYEVSRAWFSRLRAKRQGPDEIRIGRRVYVTKRAAETWERTMAARLFEQRMARGDHEVERDHDKDGKDGKRKK